MINLNDYNIGDICNHGDYDYKVIKCPCCGAKTLDSWWICDVCSWEYDGVESDSEYSHANNSTLIEYRNRYKNEI